MAVRSLSSHMPRSEHFWPCTSRGPEAGLSSACEDEGLAGVDAPELLWRAVGDGQERRKGHITEVTLG